MKKINTMILFSFLFISPIVFNAQWIDVSGNLPYQESTLAMDAVDTSTAIISYSGDWSPLTLYIKLRTVVTHGI